MPAIYKVLTALIALIGNMSLVITGEANPVFILIGSLMFVGYYRAVKGYPQASRYLIGALSSLAVLIFLFDTLIIYGEVIIAVVHLTLIFHAIKSFDIKDPWDPLQVFFMSLIQLLLASELTFSMVYGIVFVLFMVTMVFGIVYSHFIREGSYSIATIIRPAGFITLLTLFMTVIFFISLPRLRGSLWGGGIGRGIKSGFSETVRLGSLEEIKLDPTVVMRVIVESELPYTPYWRGITFELYKDNSWHDLDINKVSLRGTDGTFVTGTNEVSLISQEVVLEPLDTDVIFALKGVNEIRIDNPSLLSDIDGSFYLPSRGSRRIHYSVKSTDYVMPVYEPESFYLTLSEGMKRIRDLAFKVTEGVGEDLRKAEIVEKYLKENYRYSLKAGRATKGVSPIENFLFSSKTGYCEYYATAMVLMLRSVGIPARVVSGYIGGDYNRYGRYYIIRQSNAHTWVEAAVNGEWVSFDPTPPESFRERDRVLLYIDMLKLNWGRYVVGFSRFDQARLINTFTLPLRSYKLLDLKDFITLLPYTALAVFLILILTLILGLGKKTVRAGDVSKYYMIVKRGIGKRVSLKDSFTAAEILYKIKGLDRELYRLTSEYFELYGRLRFGNSIDDIQKERYIKLYRALRKKL